MAINLTAHEAIAIVEIAEWFKIEPEVLIHKLLEYQLDYIQKVRKQTCVERSAARKYELAKRYKILE